MTHVVAGYPAEDRCVELMLGMQKAGVAMIEIQIPFSDPSADGPVIMRANDIALENGMSIQGCFDMISNAREHGLNVPVYVMTYANKVVSFGSREFCKQAQKHTIAGLIIPDLPFETTDYIELSAECTQLGVDLVPVISPGILQNRLRGYDLSIHKLVYVTSTQGITGKELNIKTDLQDLIKNIRTTTEAQIALGFGVRMQADVEQALQIADVAVVGSAVIEKVDQLGVDGALQFIQSIIEQ